MSDLQQTPISKIKLPNGTVHRIKSNIPISPNSYGLIAGATIAANTIVYRGTDGYIYPVTDTTHYIDINWGLGITEIQVSSGARILGNNILQQGSVEFETSYLNVTNGYTYVLTLTKDNTGYKTSNSGKPQSLSLIQTSNLSYIYIGIGEKATVGTDTINQIACDFSNHIFITLSGGRIRFLNGKEIVGSAGSIAVPVTVDSELPCIGEDIQDNLVFKCATDNKLYECNGSNISTKPVDLEWGIAYYGDTITHSSEQEVYPELNSMLQKCEFSSLSNYLPSGANYSEGEDLFLVCSIGANPTPRGVSGLFSTGKIGNFEYVKSYAENYGGVVYLYVGTYTSDGYLSLDVSNHLFLTMDGDSYEITHINGIKIAQPTIPTIPTYKNPVSGDSRNIPAGNEITNNSLVFMGWFSSADNVLYKLQSSLKNYTVEPEWGLAIYKGSTISATETPANNTLFQQCEWSGNGITLTGFNSGEPLYVIFGLSSERVDGVYHPVVLENSPIITSRYGMLDWAKQNSVTEITYCYLGTVVVSGNTRVIAVDLSAHMFITEDLEQRVITKINGKDIGGTNADESATDLKTIISGCSGINGLFQYSLCCYDDQGEIASFTTSGGNGTSKVSATARKFPIGNKIYYYTDTSLNSETDFVAKEFYIQKDGVPIEYTGNISSNFSPGVAVYLHVTVDQSTGTFSPASSNLVTVTLLNGNYYIFLGWVNESGKSIMFESDNQLYYEDSSKGLVPYYDSVIGDIETVLAAI